MIDSIIGLILLFVGIPALVSLIDRLYIQWRVKDYNKRHPYDLKDVKKTTSASIDKQFFDWQIEMFAKNSEGISYYESWSNDWEVLKDEEETN